MGGWGIVTYILYMFIYVVTNQNEKQVTLNKKISYEKPTKGYSQGPTEAKGQTSQGPLRILNDTLQCICGVRSACR